MTLSEQIISLGFIVMKGTELKLLYPNDGAIDQMIRQAQYIINRLRSQQREELFKTREIKARAYRDGGSVDYYLMPQEIKIACFEVRGSAKIVSCLLSGQSKVVQNWQQGHEIARRYIRHSVGVELDSNNKFGRYLPNFKRKYDI